MQRRGLSQDDQCYFKDRPFQYSQSSTLTAYLTTYVLVYSRSTTAMAARAVLTAPKAINPGASVGLSFPNLRISPGGGSIKYSSSRGVSLHSGGSFSITANMAD